MLQTESATAMLLPYNHVCRAFDSLMRYPPNRVRSYTYLVQSHKYLGVVLGHVTPEEAYLPALQKALGQHWALALEEGLQLLQSGIPPLQVFPAKVVLPTEQVLASPKTIHSLALTTTSCGPTHGTLALPLKEGVMVLPKPKHFPLRQFSTPFTNSMVGPHTISSVVRQIVAAWSQSVGFLVNVDSLSYFHMGSNVV